MTHPVCTMPAWLTTWMDHHAIDVWGGADLRSFSTPTHRDGPPWPHAIAWAIPMNSQIMSTINTGPNRAYANEYARVNDRINHLAAILTADIRSRGFRAQALAASVRSDPVAVRGDFPHKTAATRAGLGWVGRNCQLLTRPYGPWIRLGTVFTDLEMACGPAMEKSLCGTCTICVDACPARALQGGDWYPGIPGEELMDVHACDRWKKKNYFQYHKGHNCGICSAVCPRGMKQMRKKA